ncbi:MAG: cupin domain-containing protein [bacterium]|nr:cupin domain-containing protein [bacterium]
MSEKIFKTAEGPFTLLDQGAYRVEKNRLSAQAGAQHLGFQVQRLAVGHFACPYHGHQNQEELFLILEGRALLRGPEGVKPLVAGDLVFCPTGEALAHQLYNPGPEPCLYFSCSNQTETERGYYPDTGKVIDYKLGPDQRWEMTQPVDYWAGEENPAAFWPEGSLEWPG